VIAPEAIGLIGYRLPQWYIHDFAGLTDRYISRHGTYFLAMYGKADYAYTINTVSPALIITHSADYHLLHMQSATGGTLGTRYACFRDAANTRFWFTIRKDRVTITLRHSAAARSSWNR
jgi:hypothetical protein